MLVSIRLRSRCKSLLQLVSVKSCEPVASSNTDEERASNKEEVECKNRNTACLVQEKEFSEIYAGAPTVGPIILIAMNLCSARSASR